MVNVLSLCFSALFVSNLALAASHGKRAHNGGQHVNAIQRRAAAERYALDERSDFTAPARKRSNGRCSAKTTTSSVVAPTTTSVSTSSSHSTTVTELIGNPGGDPRTVTKSSTSTHAAETTSHSSVHHTTTHTTHTTTSTKAVIKKVTTTSTSKAVATTKASSNGGGSGKTYSGQGTYYGTGLGSCGITNNDNQLIAAVSHLLYDSWPGATANPNNNPVCGRHATAHYGGKSVTVEITDRCTGCAMWDLDFSPAAFKTLADESLGRIDITWQWD